MSSNHSRYQAVEIPTLPKGSPLVREPAEGTLRLHETHRRMRSPLASPRGSTISTRTKSLHYVKLCKRGANTISSVPPRSLRWGLRGTQCSPVCNRACSRPASLTVARAIWDRCGADAVFPVPVREPIGRQVLRGVRHSSRAALCRMRC